MARVRLLQTSDVHLRPDRPERGRALSLVFELARSRSVDAVLVCGDLFDRGSDTVGQRALVRQLVESIAPRPVVFVPGNHDADDYGPDSDYGANAVVLAGTPSSRATICGLDVVAIPYQHGKAVAECLTGIGGDPRQTILMAHGTILDGAGDAFSGEGEDGSFMPIFLSDLLKRCCYAALGHRHSGGSLIHRDGERLVAYSGSPVSTSRREIGPRGVLLVDFEGTAGVLAHEHIALGTPFYEQVEVVCSPGGEEAAIEALAREARAKKKPGARVLAKLSGISLAPESELREAAEIALSRAFGGTNATETQTVSTDPDDRDASVPILELEAAAYPALADMPIIGEFVERLDACARAQGIDDPAALQAALRVGLDAFLEALP